MRVSLKRTKGFVFIAAAALLGSALMAAPQPKQDNGQQSAPDNSKRIRGTAIRVHQQRTGRR